MAHKNADPPLQEYRKWDEGTLDAKAKESVLNLLNVEQHIAKPTPGFPQNHLFQQISKTLQTIQVRLNYTH